MPHETALFMTDSTHLNYYCAKLRCKMDRESCIARQLLAIRPLRYRLNAHTLLVNSGFYPECYSCSKGRKMVRLSGLDLIELREQMVAARSQIEESGLLGKHTIRRRRSH
jgi:hypothetical protein